MTSFAFIAGLLPLVFATGAGAIGNRTIGTTGAGGMLLGTVVGVLVIPGLYYLFGRIADGRQILHDETNEPLSEVFERNVADAVGGIVSLQHADAPAAPPAHQPPHGPHPPAGGATT
jgi:HAE1 family hydrophobic/amphiphilic exporter-1